MVAQAQPRNTGEMRRPSEASRSVSRRSVIEEAKAKVSTIDLADWLVAESGGRWRKVGDECVTNCVLPGHADRSPSFTVNPDKNLWFCHGCIRGGDVVALAQRAWDIDRADVACAELLHTFGHEIPQRPAAWFRKQERQRPVRDALEEAELRHVQRRLFRRFVPLIENIADDAERMEETELMWDAAGEIAVLVLAGRRSA
jgi:DNA primase